MFANATLVSKKCQVVEFQYLHTESGVHFEWAVHKLFRIPILEELNPSRQGKFKKFKINSLKFYTGHWTRVIKSTNNTPQQPQHVPYRAAL